MPKIAWLIAAAGLALCGRGAAMAAPAPPLLSATAWTVDEGLPDSVVFSIEQTHDGYLWLGTPNGLARFDGVRFVIYDENNTPALHSRRILKVYEDGQTNLW